MKREFSPSTRRLLQLVGWKQEPPEPPADPDNDLLYRYACDENYQLRRIAIHISNPGFFGITANSVADSQRFFRGRWPIDAPLVAALRAALTEHAGGTAGHDLAHLLIRAGEEDREVVERLHPWDRLAFKWREDGVRAADIVATLRAAGTAEELAPAHFAIVDGWIAQPITALGDWFNMLDVLFGMPGRVVYGADKASDDTEHDKLLVELLASASPPVSVADVAQEEFADGEWITLEFSHANRKRSLRFEGNGPSLMIAPVVSAVDQLMADLGRPDRVFQFMECREGVEGYFFLVADAPRFSAAAGRLAIPLATQTA